MTTTFGSDGQGGSTRRPWRAVARTLGALVCASIVLTPAARAEARSVAIEGATLVDLAAFGRSTDDVRDAVILVRDGLIVTAGPHDRVAISADAERIDARGKWVVPGLIDGFSAPLDTGHAYAHLVMGVTTVSQTEDDDLRRGRYTEASPQPHARRLGRFLGYDVTGLPEDAE